MAKKYTRVNWKSGEEGNTPLTAGNLNRMDKGIYDVSALLAEFKAEQEGINEALRSRNVELERTLEGVLERLDGTVSLEDIPDAPEEAKEPVE